MCALLKVPQDISLQLVEDASPVHIEVYVFRPIVHCWGFFPLFFFLLLFFIIIIIIFIIVYVNHSLYHNIVVNDIISVCILIELHVCKYTCLL